MKVATQVKITWALVEATMIMAMAVATPSWYVRAIFSQCIIILLFRGAKFQAYFLLNFQNYNIYFELNVVTKIKKS